MPGTQWGVNRPKAPVLEACIVMQRSVNVCQRLGSKYLDFVGQEAVKL